MPSKRERLQAAIKGEVADRPPVALWRHFPVDDQEPHNLAQSTVAFQREFDFDFVKVTPASSFCLKDWGSLDRWEGNDEGTRMYTHRVVEEPQDWRELAPLDPEEGYLGEQITCLELITEDLGDDTPIIQTIFSPLAQAKNLAGQERLLEHLHREPQAVRDGLRTITDSTHAFIEAALKTGIAGIFYAVQHATYRLFDRASYRELAEADDLRLLETAASAWLNVLHLHGQAIHFELAEEYPAHVVNWHSQSVGPNLAQAADRVQGALCGGLRRQQHMVLGDPQRVRAAADEALDSVNGRGLVLGAGCVVPLKAPRANISAARRAVDAFV